MSAVETKLFREELLREGEELAVFASAQRESTPSRALLGELAEKMRQSREVDGPVRQAIEHAEELGIRREFRREVLRVGKRGSKRLTGVVLLELDEKERGEKQKEKKGRGRIRAFLRSLNTDRAAIAMENAYWASLDKVISNAESEHIAIGAAVIGEIERRKRSGTYDSFRATSISEAITIYIANPRSRLPELTGTVLFENIYGEQGGMVPVLEKIRKAALESAKEFDKRGFATKVTAQEFEFLLEQMMLYAKMKGASWRSGSFAYNTPMGVLDDMKRKPQIFSTDRYGLRDDAIIAFIDGATGNPRKAVRPMLERLGDDDDARGVLLLIREGLFEHKERTEARHSGRELPYG